MVNLILEDEVWYLLEVPPASAGFAPFQANEKTFHAVKRVFDPDGTAKSVEGDVDNFHDIVPDKGVHVPGCRPTEFSCLHMHWRWNGGLPGSKDPLIDVLVEPSDDNRINFRLAGTPYLVSGQKIDVGIVKFKDAEQDFFINPASSDRPNADPLSLARNVEQIALGIPSITRSLVIQNLLLAITYCYITWHHHSRIPPTLSLGMEYMFLTQEQEKFSDSLFQIPAKGLLKGDSLIVALNAPLQKWGI